MCIHIDNRKILKTTLLSNTSLMHLIKIYWVSTMCQALKLQQWTKCTKIKTKVLALKGAHSLVGVEGWYINNKENQ